MAGSSGLLLSHLGDEEAEEEQEGDRETLDLNQPCFLQDAGNPHPSDLIPPRFPNSQPTVPSVYDPIVIDSSSDDDEEEEEEEAMVADVEIHEIEDSDSDFDSYCSDGHDGVRSLGCLDHCNHRTHVDTIDRLDSWISEESSGFNWNLFDCHDWLRSVDLFDRSNQRTHVDPIDGLISRVFENFDLDSNGSDGNDRARISPDLLNRSNHQSLVDPIDGSDSLDFEVNSSFDSNYYYRVDRASTLDLFNRSSHQTHVNPVDGLNYSVVEGNTEMGPDLELRLGLGIDRAMTGGGSGDGFFVGNSAFESAEPPFQPYELEGNDGHIDPINVNSDGEDEPVWAPDDLDPHPFHWDHLLFEDRRDPVEYLEREEIEQTIDGREAVDMEIETVINAAFDDTMDEFIEEMDIAAVAEGVVHNLDWEFPLVVDNREGQEMRQFIDYIVEDDDDTYHMVGGVQFSQFVDAENSLPGGRPAARSVIENLPSGFVTKEDIENNNAICAVCNEDISLKEQVKLLPCGHRYHGDCIFPWLRIQNTCPVCRFELPTDDHAS